MLWTYLFLFLTVVTAVLGFLGIGFGVIEEALYFFYIFLPLSVLSYFLEARKKRKRYYD